MFFLIILKLVKVWMFFPFIHFSYHGAVNRMPLIIALLKIVNTGSLVSKWSPMFCTPIFCSGVIFQWDGMRDNIFYV